MHSNATVVKASHGIVCRRLIHNFQPNIYENHICFFCFQALPYVGLLIIMMFFIYAVVGMQVCQVN